MKDVFAALKSVGLNDQIMVISGGQASYASDVETYGVAVHAVDASEALAKIND